MTNTWSFGAGSGTVEAVAQTFQFRTQARFAQGLGPAQRSEAGAHDQDVKVFSHVFVSVCKVKGRAGRRLTPNKRAPAAM